MTVNTMADHWRRHPLTWLLPALVAARAVVLYAGTDAIILDEELATGLIGTHVLSGLRLPFLQYQVDVHLSGSLLVGLMAAPVFALLGPSLLALKLVPLSLHIGTFVFWFLICDRAFGRACALVTSLLFIFAPPLLIRFSLVGIGFHPETMFFTAAAVYCVARLTDGGPTPARWHWGLGVVCGLGVTMGYIFLATIVTTVIYRTVVEPRWFTRRGALLWALGTMVGLTPWLAFNLSSGWMGATWLVDRTLNGPVNLLWRAQAAVRFLTIDLYYSFAAPLEGWPQVAMSSLYGLATVAGLLGAVVAIVRAVHSARPLLWCLFYPPVLAAAYVVNLGAGPGVGEVEHVSYEGYRYLLPLYPMLLVMMGVTLTTLGGYRPWGRRAAAGVVAALLLAGIGGTVTMLSTRNAGRLASYRPSNYMEFAAQRGSRPHLPLDGLTDADRRRYALGQGWLASRRLLEGGSLPDDVYLPRTTEQLVVPAASGTDPEGRALVCAALRWEALERAPADRSCVWHAMVGVGASRPLSSLPSHRFTSAVRERLDRLAVDAAQAPTDVRAAVFEGFGHAMGTGLELTVLERLEPVLDLVDRHLSSADRLRVYRGLGRGLAWRFGYDAQRLGDLIKRVPADVRSEAQQGVREFEARLATY